MFHIQKLSDQGELEGITFYQFDDNFRLVRARYASSAIYDGQSWILFDVKETRLGELNSAVKAYDHIIWNSHFSPDIMRTIGVKHTERLSLREIWASLQYQKDNELFDRKFAIAFWDKVYQPFYSLVMAFLALAISLSSLNLSSSSLRATIGVLLGLALHFSHSAFVPIGVGIGFSPALVGITIPLSLWFIAFAVWQRSE